MKLHALIFCTLTLFPAGFAWADASATPGSHGDAARQYFTDTELLDQNGQPQRFYSDLLAGKVVVINPFFTSCKGVCPVMTANLAKIQRWLGDRLGKEVHLISISVDPENDTPERVKAYAETFGAREGWYFLTGPPEQVRLLLGRLGEKVDDPANHSSLMFLGNVPTELWKKVQGLSNADEIIAVLDTVMRDEE